ncbi:hypothetical protein [Mesorhizobium sp. B4-1-4]|uniref:hypothetical protein n=1 Tax=Mesorhizobium sp. B4-1-4 TaxID=2589888 RepID=UPI0039B10FC7
MEDKHAKLSVLFDRQANPLPGRDPDYPDEDQALPVNARLLDHVRQAISIAPGIAGNLDYIRIDFLVTDDRLYVGALLGRRPRHLDEPGDRSGNRTALAA